jgi:2',3'-cyclic-nucleotide 2'-phosphodiesterase (5'-nucleotidase family)
LNFLHSTDTHGWLEGHLKEQNYGADWGDFVSFTKTMKKKAKELDVDLLLVDTGDLHDGAGLSDVTSPNGLLSNPVFEHVDYDLLTIGNHELYLSDIAYLTADTFAKYYGDKYISSNVQIFNNKTQKYEDIANKYRYFTTAHGLRIMAFGLLYDFTGNSNASKVIPAATVVQQPWFKNALNFKQPIDLFLVIGHNPVQGDGSTISTIQQAIRAGHPNTPIQVFGGHTHIRDFAVYDSSSTGMESGRYCETLGWLAMNGIKSSAYNGTNSPKGVPHPSQPAVNVTTAASTPTAAADALAPTKTSYNSSVLYQRRYLDWNRLTFAYHAEGSQSHTFDTPLGEAVTTNITNLRHQLNLTELYGCAPQTWCLSCAPYLSNGSIFSLLAEALSVTVVNKTRAKTPRMILINTGSVRFDLVEGPFTLDDSYIVSPFTDTFQFIPDVPYKYASKVLGILNAGGFQKRSAPSIESRDLQTRDFGFNTFTGDDCVDAASVSHASMLQKREHSELMTRGLRRSANATLTPGYTTSDDFGSDGDDTIHSRIPYYSSPNDLQANASFPTDGSKPQKVDLIFLDYIGGEYVIPALKKVGANYTIADIQQYLPPSFDTNAYLPAYAKLKWQKNVPNCPVGKGVGYGNPGA